MSPQQSERLYDALKQKGVPAEIELYPDVGHGFLKDAKPDTPTVARAMAKLSAFLAATFPNQPATPDMRHTVAKSKHPTSFSR